MNVLPVSLTYSLELIPLGQNFFWKMKIILFWLVLFIKRHMKIYSRSEWFFKLCYRHEAFDFYLRDEIDVQSLVGVVLRGEYEMTLSTEPKVIVDLGSNIGTSILYFMLRYPNAVIYGYEPNPAIFRLLKKNTDQFDNVKVYNYALSDHSGVVDFFIQPHKSSASSIIDSGDRSEAIEVPCVDLAKVKEIAGKEIDLLKFDIEGAEEKVFTSSGLRGVANVVGEVHLWLMNISDKDFMLRFNGYETEQEWRDPKYFILRAKKR